MGTVLILGFALATISAMVLIGGASLTDVQNQVSTQRAESELSQLDSRASQVALGQSNSQLVRLPSDRDEGLTVSDAGRVWLVTDDGQELLNESLGTVTYSANDDVVAYQGGGVWRGTGRETRMVSAPELHYRDGTLTLPLVRVVPGSSDASPGQVLVENGPNEYGIGPGETENTQVSMVVQSDHYVGWANYMETRAEGSVRELDHDDRVAVVDLGHLTIDGTFETGLVAQGDITEGAGNPTIVSEAKATGGVTDGITCDGGSGSDCYTDGTTLDLQPLDDGIEQLVDESGATDPDVTSTTSSGGLLDQGTYYADEVLLEGDTLTLDVSQGNVTLFVDGHVGIANNGRIDVVGAAGTDHVAKVFATGDFALATGGAGVAVDGGEPERFQLYGTSEMHFGIGQGDFTGVVYAPRDESATGSNEAIDVLDPNSIQCTGTDVCVSSGSSTVRGAIVSGPMEFSQSPTFEYDEDVVDTRPSLPSDANLPPPLTFLHVSVNEIRISGPAARGQDITLADVDEYVDDESESTPAGTPTPTPSGTPASTPTHGGTPTPGPVPTPSPTPDCTGPPWTRPPGC